MSLDIYLEFRGSRPCTCECGHQHRSNEPEVVFEANVTHNLNRMADAAGIYSCLWHPGEERIERAGDLVPKLSQAISLLEASPEKFRAHNPSNGWGSYEGFLSFLRDLRAACVEWPAAHVRACG